MEPIFLSANQPAARFYSGGRRIAEFRGTSLPDSEQKPYTPEDWVGSTTTTFGSDTVGLTVLPSGKYLRDDIRENPVQWLGRSEGAADPILVKLLDAGERLPVHIHPTVPFSQEHFGLDHGKTEGWLALRPSSAHVAFTRDIAEDELRDWVDNQRTELILANMHEITFDAGDAIYLPAGLPHAIGADNFLVELQEPVDLSIMLEWKGFPLDGPGTGHLGLGFDTALKAVDRRGWTSDEVASLVSKVDPNVEIFEQGSEFFRAQRVHSGSGWEAGFGVLLVTSGQGELRWNGSSTIKVSAGDTILLPFSAGACELRDSGSGEPVTAYLCRPPLASV